jgi:heme A synthase
LVPHSPLNATLIEFSHRLTSGIAFASVLVLAVWAYRAFPRGSGVRSGAWLALASIVVECAIGAGLVLMRLVGANASVSRGLWLATHLINTMLLVATLSITAWRATSGRHGDRYGRVPWTGQIIGLSIGGFLCAAVLGGVAALGDTLAVPTSLAASIREDFSPLSNIFVRLRILHPLAAGAVGSVLLLLAARVTLSERADAVARRLATAMAALVLLQFTLGIADIFLKTPVPLQMLHLLVANLLWISLVLLVTELRPWVGRGPLQRIDALPTNTSN